MAVKKKDSTLQGYRVLENECIWMKAGVVNFRLCDNVYDCFNCPFDKGMRKAMGIPEAQDSKAVAPRWVEHLQKRFDGTARPCRHALTGRIDAPKICPHNYECYHCSYDQWLDEMDMALLDETPAVKIVSGFRLAEGYYYHMGHTWARFEHGGRVRVGFDDFLGKVFASDYVELPPPGAALKQNQVAWAVGRGDDRAAVLSPVTGTVLALNHKACEHPDISHVDPYHTGWLLMLEPDMPKRNLKGLYFGKESQAWLDRESQTLMDMLGPEYSGLAATGGEVVADLPSKFPHLDWTNLADAFLRTRKK